MELPADPYTDLDTDVKVKLQAYVSPTDKDLLMTVIPNRGLYTLLIAHALKRTADFVRDNQLEYNPEHQRKLLDFIVTGAAPAVDGPGKSTAARPTRNTNARNGSGRASRVRTTPEGDSDQSTSLRQGSQG